MHHFSSSDVELAQVTKAQGQDIFQVTDNLFLCQIFASNNFPLQIMAEKELCIYYNNLELAQMILC